MAYTKIRDLREDADLTQAQMAKVLNCSQQAYSNYELGQRDIPTDILIALAEFHKTNVDKDKKILQRAIKKELMHLAQVP